MIAISIAGLFQVSVPIMGILLRMISYLSLKKNLMH